MTSFWPGPGDCPDCGAPALSDHETPCVPEPAAQSPFTDSGLQFAWDSTCITVAQECPRRYQLKIIEGWRSKAPGAAIALSFGILIHAGIEHYHRLRTKGLDHNAASEQTLFQLSHGTGPDGEPMPELWQHYQQLPTEDEFQQAKAAADEDEEDDGVSTRNARVRTRYHLWRALVWYFEHYREDPLAVHLLNGTTPSVELSFRVPLGFALSDGTEVILAGHLDKVVEFNKQLFVSDIKTTKSITASWRRDFDLSQQMTGYTLGGKLALHEPVAGVVIDGICLQVGGVKFARHFTYRTDSQLGEHVREVELLTREYEMYSLRGYYPKRTSFCRFCEFREVCAAAPEVRQGILNYHFRQEEAWNPLKSR